MRSHNQVPQAHGVTCAKGKFPSKGGNAFSSLYHVKLPMLAALTYTGTEACANPTQPLGPAGVKR